MIGSTAAVLQWWLHGGCPPYSDRPATPVRSHIERIMHLCISYRRQVYKAQTPMCCDGWNMLSHRAGPCSAGVLGAEVVQWLRLRGEDPDEQVLWQVCPAASSLLRRGRRSSNFDGEGRRSSNFDGELARRQAPWSRQRCRYP